MEQDKLEQAIAEFESKITMYDILRLRGVWCKGKRAACRNPYPNACKKCKHYDGRGVGNAY